MAPNLDPDHVGPSLVDCPVRRFLCLICRTTHSVYPPGVLPRCTYTLFAMLVAWHLATSKLRGRQRSDPEVYRLQGVERRDIEQDEDHRCGRRRWRQMARWVARASDFWPSVAVAGSSWRERAASCLAAFGCGAGLADGLVRAWNAHVGAVSAM